MKKLLKVEIEVPMVPNFLRYGERKTLPVSAFTEAELREIGKLWTEALVKNAKKKTKLTSKEELS